MAGGQVGDIVIDIKVNASQAKNEMDKTKNDIKKKAEETSKAVEESAKKGSESVKKGGQEAGKTVGQESKKAGDEVKKAGDDIKKTSDETGKTVKNNTKGVGDSVQTTTKSASSSLSKMGTALQSAGNRITAFGKKIKTALKTDAALAFAAVGAAATSFAKQCIDSAIKAESEWTRFGTLVNSNGGNWDTQKGKIKDWARTFSNNMGYAVSDTREASLNLLQYGLSMEQVQAGMSGVAGLAARAGISEAEASQVIISALAGRGTQLKKLTGLKIEDYKLDKDHVDTMKLLTDLYRQNEEALRKHGETTEAQMARVDNSWGRLKTTIGNSLMPVVKLVADVMWLVAEAFDKLPDPIKTAISAFLLIGGIITTVIGIAGMLAPGIIALGEAVGGVAGVIAFLTGPIGIAIAAILLFVGTLYYLYNTNETVRNALNGLGSWLMGTFAGIWNALAPVLQGVWTWLTELASSIGSVLIPRLTDMQAAVQPVINVFQWLFQACQRLWNALTGANTSGASEGFNVLAAAGEVLKIVITLLIDAGLRLINGVLSILSGVIVVVVGAFTLLIEIITAVAGAFQNAGNFISWLIQQFNNFVSIVMSKAGSIADIFTTIIDAFSGNIDPSAAFLKIVADIQNIISGTIVQIIVDELNNVASAFMDTGAILAAISNAFTQVVDWFKSVLGIASPGHMARAIQEEMGHIAEFISGAVGAIVGAIVELATGIWNGFIGALSGLGEWFGGIASSILQAFNNIPVLLGQFFATLPAQIGQFLMNAVMAVQVYITMIRNAIVMRFQMMVMQVSMVWSFIVNAIRMRLQQAWMIASNLANMIRNAIITRFNLIIARVRSIFQNIVTTIRSRLQNAVSQARTKAQQIYQGIKDKVSQIPQMVADEFGKIKDRIISKLNDAKNAAVSKISELVAAVKSALGIASPGFIQRMFIYEFTSIPEIINNESLIAIKEAGNMATGIVDAWNDGMGTGLSVPFEALKDQVVSATIVSDDAFNPQMSDLLIASNMSNDASQILSNGMLTTNTNAITNNTNNLQRSTIVHEGDSKTIVIEHFENKMELAKLSKAESRSLLYDALDGLYTGGM